MTKYNRFNLFRGVILLGNTAISGSSFIPGYCIQPLKTLITIDIPNLYREYGLVAHYPLGDCYRIEALNYLDTIYRVYQKFMLALDGEEVSRERWQGEYIPIPEGQIRMFSVCNDNDDYIGSPEYAIILAERNIVPEQVSDGVCSIGWSESEQTWYGWSHRAMCGFKIGDRVDSENHLCTQSGWLESYYEANPDKDYRLPVGFEAKTNDDAKKMAIAYADAIG